jgi:membrane protease subunit (stomatin/prohibitin family)
VAILDFISKQFIDIIEWTDDSRDTLSYRFPDEDKEIKRGAQLIVRESQVAQFVYLGQFGDTFGAGKYTLTTDNIPVLSDLKGWKYGLESPFKADVYYVITRLFTGNKWGTANPVMMRDQDFGVVRLRAFGIYDFRIVDPKLFLKEVAGTDDHFRLDEFNDTMRSRIVSVFSEALAQSRIPALDVATRYAELGAALLPLINPQTTSKYGLEITSFVVENVSVPPEVEQAIDKRSSMAAVGNLNDYVKFQMAQGLEKGEGGAGGMATQMAVGMAMAQRAGSGCGAGGSRGPHDAGTGRAASRGGRIRRHGQSREGRPEGQADRDAVAHHAGGRRSVSAFLKSHESVCPPARAAAVRRLVSGPARGRRCIRAGSASHGGAGGRAGVARASRQRGREREPPGGREKIPRGA